MKTTEVLCLVLSLIFLVDIGITLPISEEKAQNPNTDLATNTDTDSNTDSDTDSNMDSDLDVETEIERGQRDWMLICDNQNNVFVLNLKEEPQSFKVADSEVSFHYRSRNSLSSNEFTVSNVADNILKTDFDPKQKTMFIIHGWNSNKGSSVNSIISKALMRHSDWNIFIVDWSGPANLFYTGAKGAVPEVGRLVALFIERLVAAAGVCPCKVHLVGHSLGAHVAGRAGAVLGGNVASIVGLDPAMPLFSYKNLDDRLDPSDARYVEVIHTNGGFLGFQKPLGHSDFYPNGGKKQKGCGADLFGLCSHGRAYEYFGESIGTGKFISQACGSMKDYEKGNCRSNHEAHMGGMDLDLSAIGDYYLETSNNDPYALN